MTNAARELRRKRRELREVQRSLADAKATGAGARVVEGREYTRPEWATPFADMVAVGKLAAHGGDRKSKAEVDQPRNTSLIGHSDTAAYILARLERDAGQGDERAGVLLERVQAGELSAHAAAIDVGRMLIDAKAQLPHGEFGTMIEERLPISRSTAKGYMAIARHAILSNGQHVGLLPPSWGTLADLARLESDVLQAAIESGAVHPEMQRRDVKVVRQLELDDAG